ncbi:hypothetical protein WICPIJ_004726 [Wickerhamomyces pijperi]|uniref:Uncharacterized protein n=1 Tax=Wickerhamomyces pijperi TaxID=599730 RepID=A0A9P8Q5D8_WICPI|nr:hypothetical protein WICPIJ_004726 [Wickerhamomyces pijperi]
MASPTLAPLAVFFNSSMSSIDKDCAVPISTMLRLSLELWTSSFFSFFSTFFLLVVSSWVDGVVYRGTDGSDFVVIQDFEGLTVWIPDNLVDVEDTELTQVDRLALF